jgi:hypothetical protein
VAAPTTLQWTPQTTCTHATAPANFQFAGITFQLDALQGGVLQPGFQFLTPITLILHYTDQDVAGLQEATLELDYWDEASGSWQDAACGAGYTRDPVNNQLTVEICHLSEFGLFGSQNTWLYVPLVTH